MERMSERQAVQVPFKEKFALCAFQAVREQHTEILKLNCSPRNQRYSMNNFPDNNASRPRYHEYRVYNNYGHSTETTV